uniref:Uncharacterized protein n=2 Tax=Timema TaxID=61471 RepID=A0A7R9FW70_TIMSH|nr:unnamed protein product [Timema shepardi]CAD7567917.1 unnamed protein product [Timema californicum]
MVDGALLVHALDNLNTSRHSRDCLSQPLAFLGFTYSREVVPTTFKNPGNEHCLRLVCWIQIMASDTISGVVGEQNGFSIQDNGSAKFFQGALHTPNMGEKVAQVTLNSIHNDVWSSRVNRLTVDRLILLYSYIGMPSSYFKLCQDSQEFGNQLAITLSYSCQQLSLSCFCVSITFLVTTLSYRSC